jgi:hypothetical protein
MDSASLDHAFQRHILRTWQWSSKWYGVSVLLIDARIAEVLGTEFRLHVFRKSMENSRVLKSAECGYLVQHQAVQK